jgi:hypothetical protein
MMTHVRPTAAALMGILLILPLVAANVIVADRIEPFFSIIRPGTHTSAREYVLLGIVLVLLPAGAWLAARPMLARGVHGHRRLYPLNALLAAILLLTFVAVSFGLAVDIYRCDVLGIPSCD